MLGTEVECGMMFGSIIFVELCVGTDIECGLMCCDRYLSEERCNGTDSLV